MLFDLLCLLFALFFFFLRGKDDSMGKDVGEEKHDIV